ncbi:MAG: VOC family protein [Maritimibacter sp.]|nr:VOC family protein [Maritimibacter sp.]
MTHARPEAPAGVLEAAVYVADLDAAEAFYGGVIGLDVMRRQKPRHVFFTAGQSVVLVFNPAETVKPPSSDSLPVPPHGATGAGHICFRVPGAALDGWADHLVAEDVEIEADFTWPNGARSIYVRDPGDNSVEFAEPKLWGFEA